MRELDPHSRQSAVVRARGLVGARAWRGVAASTSACAALMMSNVAHASPQDIFGYGPRTSAMGATGTAGGLGVDTVWANPALLPLTKDRELSLGFQAARMDLYARGNGLPGSMHPQPMKGTLIGAVLPVPFGGVLQQRVALGFGFFTPTDVVVRGRVLYPEVPQFALLADRMQTVGIMAGFGLDLGKGIRVGAGFSVLAAIAGTVVVGTDNSGSVGTKVDDQLVSSFAKTFGASYDIGKHYRVGVTYRSKLEARFAVRIEVNDLGQLTVPPLNIAGIAQYDPWNLQAEVARVVGRVKVNVGLTYKHWSSYPGAPEPTVICPAGTPDCQALVPDPPRFHNTFTPRLGAEYDLASGQGWVARLRGGYFYEPTPTPKQTTKANGFDNDRHVITIGYGLDLAKPLPPVRLDMFSQLHVLAPRTHVKDATVPSDWAGAPQAKTGGTVFAAGLVGTVRF